MKHSYLKWTITIWNIKWNYLAFPNIWKEISQWKGMTPVPLGSQKPTGTSGCWGSGSSFWAAKWRDRQPKSGCDWPTKIHQKGEDMYLSSTDAEKVRCTTVLVGCHFSIFLGYIHSCIHESRKVFSLGWPRFDILTLFPTPRLVLYLFCLQFWHILTYLSC